MYIHKHTISLTASTTGGVTGWSTVLYGAVYGLRFSNDQVTPLSTKRTLTIGRESSADVVFKTAIPSSNCNRYPRTVCHGTSGNQLDSTIFRLMVPLTKERLKANIDAASSINSVSGTLTVYLAGG